MCVGGSMIEFALIMREVTPPPPHHPFQIHRLTHEVRAAAPCLYLRCARACVRAVIPRMKNE